MKKILIRTAYSLLVFLVFIAVVILLGSRDEALEPADDFAVVVKKVKPEENAYTFIQEAAELMKLANFEEDRSFIRSYLKNQSEDHERAKDIFEKKANREAIALIDKIVTCQTLQTPEDASYMDNIIGVSRVGVNLNNLVLLKIHWHLNKKENREALALFDKAFKLSHFLSSNSSSLMGYMMTKAVFAELLGSCRQFAQMAVRDKEAMTQLIDYLEWIEIHSDPLVHALKSDFRFHKKMIQSISLEKSQLSQPWWARFSQLAFKNYYFHLNETLNGILHCYRGGIEHAQMNYFEVPSASYISDDSIMSVLAPNGWGRMFIDDVLMGASRKGLEMQAKSRMKLALTKLFVHMQLYRESFGSFPKKLTDLNIKIPTDPCDGQPLKYDAENGVIYSTGPDKVDSGGYREAIASEKLSFPGDWGRGDFYIFLDRRY